MFDSFTGEAFVFKPLTLGISLVTRFFEGGGFVFNNFLSESHHGFDSLKGEGVRIS
jgi:hypothetical protein